jgi:putative PEP-CTERM system histidine kinase
MMLTAWFSLTAFFAAAMAGGLSALLLTKGGNRSSYRRVATLLGATAVWNLANGLELVDGANELYWRQAALVAELIQPAVLFYVGLAFLNPIERGRAAGALWPARGLGVCGVLLVAMTVLGHVFATRSLENGQIVIVLGTWGRVPYVFIVVAMALGVAQLEVVLRGSREPFRHRLKLTIIGLGGLAGFQIYQASQMLLIPIWKPEQTAVSSVVTILALAVIAYGLGRNRLREILVDVSVSPQALVGSASIVIVGGYLFAVGAVGFWLRETNQPVAMGLGVVVAFAALVGMVITVFSKTVRARFRHAVLRNFSRSKYDYRAQWAEVTEAFQQAVDRDVIMDILLDMLIKTFPTTTLSIWSFREADRRFIQVRSMLPAVDPTPLALAHPIVTQLMRQGEAVLVEQHLSADRDVGEMGNDPLISSSTNLCFPIRVRGRLIAFLALGRPLHGEVYGTDECDLLRGMSHHVGMLLSHVSLVEERRAAVELEAVHRFSVFCLHDLKNLAARLSLVAQNAERHGDDPAFQQSAIGTVKDTAYKMTALISKLSLKSLKPSSAGMPEQVELSDLIEVIVAPLRGGTVTWHILAGTTPPILGVRDEIHQVLLNILLNAKQAVSEQGEITIALSHEKGFVLVTVQDNGRGIPDARLESLFLPAQSSRPGGLGIGLYQCKQIVEAHQGTIEIHSVVGRGTQVQLAFPVPSLVSGRLQGVLAGSVASS